MFIKKQSKKGSLQQIQLKISKLCPLAKGSLAQVKNACMRVGCRTCKTGKKHRAYIFSYLKKGRRHCRYVPLKMVSSLQEAIQNGRQLNRLMNDLGPKLILEFRQKHQRKGGRWI
jgi:hypothetical protein